MEDDIYKHREEQKGFFDKALIAKGKKKPSPTGALTQAVINYVHLRGGAARRVNSTGVFVPAKYIQTVHGELLQKGTGQFRNPGTKKGFEDVDAIMPVIIKGIKIGIKVAIEIKVGKDTQSEHQIERMEEVRAVGGAYIIAKSSAEFPEQWDEVSKMFHVKLSEI